MRSHWTNPTIIRRPTIAALSAAALLVACDQPAGPSRPSGGIQANATGGTVSAHGSGTVSGYSQDNDVAVFNLGGLKFSFDLSGPGNVNDFNVAVTGTWSASDPVTNVQLDFTTGSTALAFVSPSLQTLSIRGTCTITTANGTQAGNCELGARDGASNGAVDIICFRGSASNGLISAPEFFNPNFFSCNEQLASGNMNID